MSAQIKVDVYVKPACPYCQRAEMLLGKRNVTYNRIDISKNEDDEADMLVRSNGRKTVPQIFVGETHIGGADDLSQMPRKEFMALL
jgi:glutaredoxin 3